MHFRDSPNSENGLGIPGNNRFRRFAVSYIYIYILHLTCVTVFLSKNEGNSWLPDAS